MSPQAWGVFDLVITGRAEFLTKVFVCETSCLWQAVYGTSNFNVDEAIFRLAVQVVLFMWGGKSVSFIRMYSNLSSGQQR